MPSDRDSESPGAIDVPTSSGTHLTVGTTIAPTVADALTSGTETDEEVVKDLLDRVGVVRESGADSSVGKESALEGVNDLVEAACVVPGCRRPGKNKLGVRCRVWHEPSPIPGKKKTSALWAPDADAFLCDEHALSGAHITLIYEPNSSGETAVRVIGAARGEDRRRPIKRPDERTER